MPYLDLITEVDIDVAALPLASMFASFVQRLLAETWIRPTTAVQTLGINRCH